MTKEERLKEVLEYRISRAQNEPIDDMDWFIENTIKDVLEAVNPLPSDLEKAAIDKEAKEYAFNNSEDSQEYKSGYLGFIAGAEWNREQMMKEAVKGEVYKFGEVAYVKERSNAELTKYLSQFNNGDKVKIIVTHETDIR